MSSWADSDRGGVLGRVFSYAANGDANADGAVDVADVFYLVGYLFAGTAPPLGPCDVNGDGKIDVADVFYLINALFADGPPPAN